MDKTPSRLAGNLRGARLQMGMTQSEVAEELGLHVVTVSNHERGATVPDDEMLRRYSKLYRYTVADLRYGEISKHWVGRTRVDDELAHDIASDAAVPPELRAAAKNLRTPADRLRFAMLVREQSTRALSEASRISEARIESILQKVRMPTPQELEVFARALLAEPSWFVAEREDSEDAEDEKQFELESIPAGISASRRGRGLRSQKARIRMKEVVLELAQAGAEDAELDWAEHLLRSPDNYVFNFGGTRREMTEEEELMELEGLAAGIRLTLEERRRRRGLPLLQFPPPR